MAGFLPITQLAGNHRALFEGYWSLVDKSGGGTVTASIAAEFLKKSQLRESVLHKIWELSDTNSTGFLDKQGFFTALRLVAACQSGKEPSVTKISLTDPPPRFHGIDPGSLDGQGKWKIDKDEQSKYEQIFQSLQLSNGLLPGDKARPFMITSKLPVDVLGKVWSLSDIDKDGSLDKDEFAVAMKLISLAQAGETLPPSLPSTMIPLSKTKNPVVGVSFVPTSVSGSTHSTSPLPTGNSTSNWVVTPEAKAKYDTYFQGIDKDHDGIVSGDEARQLFMASNLPPPQLAHIWRLCDIEHTGKLNSEQFALAMFIIAEKVRGKEVPSELTPAMIPPSLRKRTPPPTSTPTHSSATGGWSTWGSNPMPGVAIATSVATATLNASMTAWSTPGSEANGDSMAEGFGSDFSAIKELDSISKEVDSIRKEKAALSEEIKSKQELILQRKAEVESLAGEVESSAGQRDQLERERVEAQGRLEELDREKARVDSEIADLKTKCQQEQKEIERLKEALSAQEVSKKSQTEELEKLRAQLEALKKEENEYKEKVEASAADLDKLQKAHQNIQSQISQTRHKIESYKEEHQTLSGSLSLYPPVSTPSSTTSGTVGVVNIGDMGLAHLPSELPVPHIAEHDAISARATAGSSSPVSSISGFSTNSHLDDVPEETTSKTEDKRTNDPFNSTQATGDPFAAFSLPPDDPFAVASGNRGAAFKPSDLSAFDPFGASDPFKSTTAASRGAPSEDLFKSDPFGSSSAASKAEAPPTSSAGSTDPFSGQDPFSSDPFSGNERKDEDQLPTWTDSNPFPVDPFGSQSTNSDPFSSADPFGDDPFSRGGVATRETPFQQSTTTSKDVKIPESLPKPGPHTSNAERLLWAQRESEREEAIRRKRQLEEEEALAKAIRDSIKNT